MPNRNAASYDRQTVRREVRKVSHLFYDRADEDTLRFMRKNADRKARVRTYHKLVAKESQ